MAATIVSNLVGTSNPQFGCYGTDLGASARLPNGETVFVFGDTFGAPGLPDRSPDWRSPVLLRSNRTGPNGEVVFASAAGGAHAKEILPNAHQAPFVGEVTRIPNDIFVIGDRLWMSFFSVRDWSNGTWRSNYARLAYSDDAGENWTESDCTWWNNANHTDVYQLQSWVVDGECAYLFSTSNGRDIYDGLYVARVDVRRITDRSAYQTWGFRRTFPWWPWAGTWGWGNPATPVISGVICEPSVRKIEGTYVFSTLDLARNAIVTRTANAPDRPWTNPKVQVDSNNYPRCYGGFIHPASTLADLHMTVSQWTPDQYHVMQFRGSAL